MRVVVLGASKKSHRYAFKAQQALMNNGYDVVPVSRRPQTVLGIRSLTSLREIPADLQPIHTVTVYVNSDNLEPMLDDLIQLSPQRVIFNPGAESQVAVDRLSQNGIESIEACTLVMLSLGTFEPRSA